MTGEAKNGTGMDELGREIVRQKYDAAADVPMSAPVEIDPEIAAQFVKRAPSTVDPTNIGRRFRA